MRTAAAVAVALIFAQRAEATEKRLVVVLDLQARDVDADVAAEASATFAAEITRLGCCTVVRRPAAQSDKARAELARTLGASLVAWGSVKAAGAEATVALELVDPWRKQVVERFARNAAAGELNTAIAEGARQLFAGTMNEMIALPDLMPVAPQAAAPPPPPTIPAATVPPE